MTTQAQALISIIAPMYNESGNLHNLLSRVVGVMEKIGNPFEIICIDDGSSDDTLEKLAQEHQKDARIKVVSFSRNFGKEVALTAGLHHASGQAVVLIDADLQHPPEIVEDLVKKWYEGFDMVIAVRKSRATETFFKRLHAKAFYSLFTMMSDTKIRPDAGDFRLLDRKVVNALNLVMEKTRFMKGLYSWVGFKSAVIPYEPAYRQTGATKWSFFRLWRFALDGLTAFSAVPLKVWTVVGLVIAAIGLFYGLFLIVKTLVSGVDVPGYASLMVAVLFFGGVQMMTLGVFGEYLGRVFDEVKHRPLYIVREQHGFTPDKNKDNA